MKTDVSLSFRLYVNQYKRLDYSLLATRLNIVRNKNL